MIRGLTEREKEILRNTMEAAYSEGLLDGTVEELTELFRLVDVPEDHWLRHALRPVRRSRFGH